MIKKLLLSGLLAILGIQVAHACSCFITTMEEDWEKWPHIFVARVVSVEPVADGYGNEKHAQFTVLERLKGQPEQLPYLKTGDGICTIPLFVDDELLVVTDDTGSVSTCSRSARLNTPDHLGRIGVYGEANLEHFRAQKADSLSACAFSQVPQVDELIRIARSENEVAAGWELRNADMANRQLFFENSEDLSLTVTYGGCDKLVHSLEVRWPKDAPVMPDHLELAKSLVESFWPASESEEFGLLMETEQYDVSQNGSMMKYDLFHPSLDMTINYDAERGALRVSYKR